MNQKNAFLLNDTTRKSLDSFLLNVKRSGTVPPEDRERFFAFVLNSYKSKTPLSSEDLYRELTTSDIPEELTIDLVYQYELLNDFMKYLFDRLN